MTNSCQSFRLQVPLVHVSPHADTARTPTRETIDFLEGTVMLPGNPLGIVVFVAASDSTTLGACGDAAGRMHRLALGTVEIDLLDKEAARFADAATHLPLLTERLLAVLAQLTRLMEGDVIPALPVGLYASGDTTPLAIRAAAIRDASIGALACVGGLVDLAGRQYLRELKAPLLMLVDGQDAAVANLDRARPYMPGPVSAESLPIDSERKGNAAATLAAQWFANHLPRRR
jgi:hypothetical protein